MNYQETTLTNYKKIFPSIKLREISEQTGIHMTRVFRLFNGAEMKVSELEAFDHILNNYENSVSTRAILDNIKNYLKVLSPQKTSNFNNEITMHLKAYKYKDSFKLQTNGEEICQISH